MRIDTDIFARPLSSAEPLQATSTRSGNRRSWPRNLFLPPASSKARSEYRGSRCMLGVKIFLESVLSAGIHLHQYEEAGSVVYGILPDEDGCPSCLSPTRDYMGLVTCLILDDYLLTAIQGHGEVLTHGLHHQASWYTSKLS